MRMVLTMLLLALPAIGSLATDTAQDGRRLADLLGARQEQGFPLVTEPRTFAFPADHGAHPEYRNEWWYVTGNLSGPGQRRFGFELTFFRFALLPVAPPDDSAWRSHQVYIAHLAVTDVRDERFLVAQKFSRAALGLAGAEADPLRVWIDDWSMQATSPARPESWRLEAADAGFGLQLDMTALKPPVLNGDRGMSQKSAERGNASYYYSMPRWRTQGEIRIDGAAYPVSGLSWLDREWSSSALAPDQQGWDWFALQFDDGSELMVYNIRRRDGSNDPLSAGTFIAADSKTVKLNAEDLDIEVTGHWRNESGDSYPARWSLAIPKLELSVDIEPVLAGQELTTTVRYWEGAVDAAGQRSGAPLAGRGYVELTGYAGD